MVAVIPGHILTINHDPDAERPDENSIGRMVSFNDRHINFTHPDDYLTRDCPNCDGAGVDGARGENADCFPCEGTGVVDCELDTHPDVLATLSYYEHGLSKWMVGESIVLDHGGFDTVNVAGVIVWNGADDEREWWQSLDDAAQRKILDSIASEYTSWVNGDVWGYSIARNDFCMECGHELDTEPLDSCFGFIGTEWFGQAVRETLQDLGIDPTDVEIRGEYAYVLNESDLMPREKVAM